MTWYRLVVLLVLVACVAVALLAIRPLPVPPVRVLPLGSPALGPGARQGIPELHRAAATGDAATIDELLRHGARVDEPDRDGWTALHWAAEAGDLHAATLLLGGGADPNAEALPAETSDVVSDVSEARRQERRYKRALSTPLQVALDRGWLAMARSLIDAGAETEKRGEWGMTALHVAANRTPAELVELLIANGASIGAVDEAGWGPLHWAAQGCNAEAVAVLLQHKADPNRASTAERTTCETREMRWQYPVGTTPLHIAADGGEKRTAPVRRRVPSRERIATVRALLAGGADATAKDADGRKPFDEPPQDWSSLLSREGTPLNEF